MANHRKRQLNKIKHLATESLRLFGRFDELCPDEYRDGNGPVDANDVVGQAWRYAHIEAFSAFEAIDDVVYQLDPPAPDENERDEETTDEQAR